MSPRRTLDRAALRLVSSSPPRPLLPQGLPFPASYSSVLPLLSPSDAAMHPLLPLPHQTPVLAWGPLTPCALRYGFLPATLTMHMHGQGGACHACPTSARRLFPPSHALHPSSAG